MYQVGIERLFYAGSTRDSVAFFERLSKHNPKWARNIDNQHLRKQVGLPLHEREMTAEQLLREDIVAVYEAFIKRHTRFSGENQPAHECAGPVDDCALVDAPGKHECSIAL